MKKLISLSFLFISILNAGSSPEYCPTKTTAKAQRDFLEHHYGERDWFPLVWGTDLKALASVRAQWRSKEEALAEIQRQVDWKVNHASKDKKPVHLAAAQLIMFSARHNWDNGAAELRAAVIQRHLQTGNGHAQAVSGRSNKKAAQLAAVQALPKKAGSLDPLEARL